MNACIIYFEPVKVGTTRRMVAAAYGKRCGEVNLYVLESLVNIAYISLWDYNFV
jgi:thimet oligopeptidase